MIKTNGLGVRNDANPGAYAIHVSTKGVGATSISESFSHEVTIQGIELVDVSLSALENKANELTVLMTEFSSLQAIPAGKMSDQLASTHREIHYKFKLRSVSNVAWFASDLGLASTYVECLAISGISGDLNCKLSSDSTHAIITVTGFNAIGVNETVAINFVGKMAQTTGQLPTGVIEVYSVVHRQSIMLNKKEVTFMSVGNSNGQPFSSITASLSAQLPDTQTTITVVMKPTIAIQVAGHNSIVVKLPSYWSAAATPSCTVASQQMPSCDYYPGAGWVVIKLASSTIEHQSAPQLS